MDADVRQGAFGRVDEALGDPLTQAQVDELPEGAEVLVIWSGGNGPWPYTVIEDCGQRYAKSHHTDRETALRCNNPISYVGAERYHTRVWLVPEISEPI